VTRSESMPESPTSGASDAAGPPRLQLLSNGRYHVMVSEAGGGYSRWKDLALTLDGIELVGSAVPLSDDRREYAVVVRIHETGESRCTMA
jgi:hypothetical protein